MNAEGFEKATRPAVTLMVVFTICIVVAFMTYFLIDKLETGDLISVYKDFFNLGMFIIAFWFGQRQGEKAAEAAISQMKAVSDAKEQARDSG